MPGELLEELDIVRPDMEAAQLELRASPRGFKGADRNAELRVAFGQSNDRLSRVRHHRHDGKLKRPLGLIVTRRRKLKIGSSTAPVLFVRLVLIASGFSRVRPRP
jgi:hypothetical protein